MVYKTLCIYAFFLRQSAGFIVLVKGRTRFGRARAPVFPPLPPPFIPSRRPLFAHQVNTFFHIILRMIYNYNIPVLRYALYSL